MKRNKNQFPGIPRVRNTSTSESAITENVEILTGVRGSNRALLLSDLINLDDLKRKALINSATGNNSGGLPIVPGGGIEPPHAPVNLQGTGGFTFIAITWDPPTYKGHAYAEIYRADTDSFSDAVRIATEVTDIFSDSVNMGSVYYYWVRFVNKADIKGPTQGAAGLRVETQRSAEQILSEIGGLIEQSHLGDFLSSEIDKIPELAIEIDKIPQIYDDMYDAQGQVQTAKSNADFARLSTLEIAQNLVDNYYTNTQVNFQISAFGFDLKTEIENPNGSSVGASLYNNYYTRSATDEAIAQAGVLLKAEIEDPNGDGIAADFVLNYYTKVSTDEAISRSIYSLNADFEHVALGQIENALANDIDSEKRIKANASILNQQQSLANENQALSESLTLLSSRLNDSESSITIISKSFSDKTQSTARELLQLSSKFDNSTANLEKNYYTKASTDEAISEELTILKAEIEDPLGASIGAVITNDYYTKTTTDNAISDATTQLKSIIENPNGSSVGADLYNNYYTKVNADSAISNANSQLRSTIKNEYELADQAVLSSVSSDLQLNYYTKSGVDDAISNYGIGLRSTITNEYELADEAVLSSVSSDLQLNYYTKTAANAAISNATTQLKSTIENPNGSSVGADLYNNYYTKVTANTAIAEANSLLKAEIEDAQGNSVGAALQTLSETVATNDEQWAMWGVKATVGDITTSFGLVNDGVEPIFAVKGAKFAIITSQDPSDLTPVFAVTDGKTVINTAIIDQAFIQSLVTDDLLSNRVVVGSNLQTPSINYNPTTGARSQNFSMSPNGIMHAKAAVLESVVIHDANGNVVMSSTGAINSSQVSGLGDLALLNDISSTYISDFGVAVNAKITTKIDAAYIKTLLVDQLLAAKIYAENIEGDVVDANPYSYSGTITVNENKSLTIINGSIAAGRFSRVLYIGSNTFSISLNPYENQTSTVSVGLVYYLGAIAIGTSGYYSVKGIGSSFGAIYDEITVPSFVLDVPSKTSATAFSIKATITRSGSMQTDPTVKHKSACVVSIFKAGGALS